MTRFLNSIHCKPLFFVFFLFTISSCEKDLPPEDFQLHFETSFPLKDILFSPDNSWLACGGEVFESGYLIEGGTIENPVLTIDTLLDKCLNSLHLFNENIGRVIFTTGVYTFGTLATGAINNDGWRMRAIEDQYILRDVIYHNGEYIMVGGAGLSAGAMYSYFWDINDPDLEEWDSFNIDNDLYFIEKINGKIYTGGFGLLMYIDEGDFENGSWTILDEYEDHWIDISYREDVGMFILGASGRIIKSTEDGQSWKEISSPNFSGVSDYKDMMIYKDKIYLACGENICASDINDIEWKMITLESMGEINRITGNNDRIFFVTNSGKMASIAH